MIFDAEARFSNGQAVTATGPSENVIDLGATGTPTLSPGALTRDIGKGEPIPLVVLVTQAFNNLTNMSVKLETDSDEGFGSPNTVASSPNIALSGNLDTVGYRFPLEWVTTGTVERYVRLNYTLSGTAPTQGALSAGFVAAAQTNT